MLQGRPVIVAFQDSYASIREGALLKTFQPQTETEGHVRVADVTAIFDQPTQMDHKREPRESTVTRLGH